jgi:hypothetical protein
MNQKAMEKSKKRPDSDAPKKSKSVSDSDGTDETLVCSNEEEAEVERRKQLYRSDPSLQFICDQNGLSEEQFSRKMKDVISVEIFQAKLQSVSSLRHFGRLEKLSLISTALEVVSGVETLSYLRQMCVVGCGISSLEGLRDLSSLTMLNLSSNKIVDIGDSFKGLTNLETLWMNDNKIHKVSGLSTLGKLKTLWLARNEIESFGTSFDKNTALRELNLADNRVGCFREVLNLNRLPALRMVSFSDPHYGDNPVCALCNYQTYVMYQLNQLTSLDTTTISDESKQLAEATYMKKKMYYNMRIKTLKVLFLEYQYLLVSLLNLHVYWYIVFEFQCLLVSSETPPTY